MYHWIKDLLPLTVASLHDLITDQLLLLHLTLRTQELLFRNQQELLIQVSMKATRSLVKLNPFLVQAVDNQAVILSFRPLSKVLLYIQGLWLLDMAHAIFNNSKRAPLNSLNDYIMNTHIYPTVKYTFVKIQLMSY